MTTARPVQSPESVEFMAVFTAIQTVERMSAELDQVLRYLQTRKSVLREKIEENER